MPHTNAPEPVAPAPDTHLLLVRHGQSHANRDGQLAGSDSPLTDLGRRQAQLVAGWLAREHKIDAVLCSPMLRARQTAETIALSLDLPLTIQPGFEESNETYVHELPSLPGDPLAFWDHSWLPECESAPVYARFRARLRPALAGLMETYAGQTVVLVCHMGVIATIVRSLCGGHGILVSIENTGITHLSWRGNRWRLETQNATEHLAPSLTPSP